MVLGKRTGSQGHCHLSTGGGTKELEEGLTLSDAGEANGTEDLARQLESVSRREPETAPVRPSNMLSLLTERALQSRLETCKETLCGELMLLAVGGQGVLTSAEKN